MMKLGKPVKPPAPPAHLSADSKKFWRWAVDAFEMEPHDLKLLRLACENLDGAEASRQQVEKDGRIYLDGKGKPRNHPSVAQHRDCSVTAARILRELRLSETAPDARPPRIGGR
jgi:phage terminase small subunit